jgi:hypothetical protein
MRFMRFTLSERSRESIRHYLVEIGTIIVGILIALAFDGVVDRREERKMAREAAVQIENEMAANKRDLDGLLGIYPRTKQQLGEALKVIRQLIKHAEDRTQRPAEFGYKLNMPSVGLSTNGLTTAEATGALRHMDYAEVRRYADVYSLQANFTRLHDRLYDQYVQTFLVDDLSQLSLSELQAVRQSLAATLRFLLAVEGYGRTLSKSYAANIRPR